MLKKIKTFCKVLFVWIFVLLAVMPANAESYLYHYWQEYITEPEGHFYASGSGAYAPFGKTIAFAYGTPLAYNYPCKWKVSDFTGFQVPLPIENYQRSSSSLSGYGDHAAQIYGSKMGFMVNSFATPNAAEYYGMQCLYQPTKNLNPWLLTHGTSKVRLQCYYSTAGTYRTGKTVQYGQMVLSLRDKTTNKSTYLTVSMWDSRNTLVENVMMDVDIQGQYIIQTYLGNNTRYCSKHPNSASSNSYTKDAWYCAYISRENLINGLTDLNKKLNANISTNPDDYTITLLACGPEMYVPKGSNGWIAATVMEFGLVGEY